MSDLAMILRRGYAGLQRYLPPYNRGRSSDALEDAGALLLARLLFVRALEARGIEQPQLAPLLRGWQRIGRRRDLLGLLAGLARTLQRLYGGPLLAPALLDQLECEPTPVEPLLDALLDERLAATLCDPLAVAAAWAQAFAPAPPATRRGAPAAPPGAGSYAPQTLQALLELASSSAGRADPMPLVVDLAGGAGGLAALLLGRRLDMVAAASKGSLGPGDVNEALGTLRVVEPRATLRSGALLALSLAALRGRVRLPQALPVGAAAGPGLYDIALLVPPDASAGVELLGQTPGLLKPAGSLALLLPAAAAEETSWAALREALFERWAIQTLAPLDGALALVARPEPDAARRAGTRIRLGALVQAPEARRRAKPGAADVESSRKAMPEVPSSVRMTSAALRQGALAALSGAPLRLALTEAVERGLARVAAGRPLETVALPWRAKAGAPPPERGATGRRAALPKVLVVPGSGPGQLRTTVVAGWPEQGGLVVQPLALLAAERGSGVRLSEEELALLAPYTVALLAALLGSPLLALYRRLLLGASGPPGLDELRRLPVPALDPAGPGLAALLAAVEGGTYDEGQLAGLYGLTSEDVQALLKVSSFEFRVSS